MTKEDFDYLFSKMKPGMFLINMTDDFYFPKGWGCIVTTVKPGVIYVRDIGHNNAWDITKDKFFKFKCPIEDWAMTDIEVKEFGSGVTDVNWVLRYRYEEYK